MMNQDGRHSPEEAIPIVNGEETEPSSAGVVEPIVSGLFNPLSSLFIGMMNQDGRHSPEEALPIVNGEVTEPSSAGV